jgi:hypothetical protein
VSHAQINASDFVIVGKLSRMTVTNDAAVLQHVNAFGDGERTAGVLLHEQHGGALALDHPKVLHRLLAALKGETVARTQFTAVIFYRSARAARI